MRTLLLTCSVFVCLGSGVAFAAHCTPEQVLALLDKGFSKHEVQRLCMDGQGPVEPQQGTGPQPERPPAEASRPRTPDSQNSLPNIDWAPLKTVFEISQAEFGIQELVSATRGLLGSAPAIKFIAEAKRRFSRPAVPTWVRFYDADNFPVGGTELRCTPRFLRPIELGERLRCYFFFNPSTHPTVKKITFEFAKGAPTSPSSGPNEPGGGLGDGDNCSRCEVYRTRESLCGGDCSFMNPYRPGGSDAVDRCYERAAECRATAARELERCESQCRH
jgi:hypothetical protein